MRDIEIIGLHYFFWESKLKQNIDSELELRLVLGFPILDKILAINCNFDLYADRLIREYIRY
jgi:hypothetical protein